MGVPVFKSLGMREKMEISCSLDWLRYSAPKHYPLEQMIPQELSIDQLKQLPPLPHYNHACEIWPSGRIDWNTLDDHQGSLVTFGGHDLREINDFGISSKYLVDYTRQTKFCRASRIDIAIDIHNRVANPQDILDAFA